MKRTLTWAIVIIMAVTLLGCAANNSMKAQSMAYDAVKPSGAYMEEYALVEEPAAAPAPAPMVEAPQSDSMPGEQGAYAGRKIIRNYDVNLTTDTFDDSLASLNARLNEFGGYAQSSYVEGRKPEAYGEAGRTASLTLRVPAERANEFLEGVKALGTVTYVHDYADDITDAYYDTDTRLEILKIQLDRLKSILVETDNLADVIALEERISEVMLEIEDLTGTLKRYDALIALATVNVTLRENNLKSGPAAVQTTGERISEGFRDTLNGVGVFFVDFFVWFVSALPVIAILAIIAVAVILIVRGCAKKKAAKKALKAAQAHNTDPNKQS